MKLKLSTTSAALALGSIIKNAGADSKAVLADKIAASYEKQFDVHDGDHPKRVIQHARELHARLRKNVAHSGGGVSATNIISGVAGASKRPDVGILGARGLRPDNSNLRTQKRATGSLIANVIKKSTSPDIGIIGRISSGFPRNKALRSHRWKEMYLATSHFQLCPSNTCGSSNSGCNDYVTDLSEFLAMYIQNKITVEASACESVKEACYCENANNDEMCYSNCYAQAGLSYCEQQDGEGDGGETEFGQINLQSAVYCTQLDVSEQAMEYYRYDKNINNQNNNNMYNYNAQAQEQQAEQEQQEMAFFVGPHCNHGKIILGLFIDETCSIKAPQGAYEKMYFGQHLPK
ncbi:hypothetical protein ACHAWT_001426 [Skeletonema menzelii]